MNQYAGELVEDASDRLWALMGQAIHAVLERADGPGRIIEERYFVQISGWKLSGQVDVIEEEVESYFPGNTPTLRKNVLSDYKFMSVWEIIHGLKPEKTQQLNILAYLARANRIPIDNLQIVGILRDWSKSKAKFDKNYPQHQGVTIPVDLWDFETQEAFIKERIDAHKSALFELPLCTDDERWAKPDTYAVMKEGRKSALRVLQSEQEAWEWGMGNGWANEGPNDLKDGITIVHRPGEQTRCANYCAVADKCLQYQELKNADNSPE